MNIDDLKNTWDQQDAIIESNVEINKSKLSDIETKQHKSKFLGLMAMRICESIVFSIIILLLSRYVLDNLVLTAPTISACILAVFSIVGFIGSAGQVLLITKLDYSAPINILQKNILTIGSHKLQFTKLIFMSAPFYLSYVFLGFDILWGIDFYTLIDKDLMTAYVLTSCFFLVVITFMAIKLSYKNIATPWVKWTIEFLIGKHLVKLSGVVNNLEKK
jgi:hypothetical protein